MEINKIPKEIFDNFEKANPQFLVVGIRKTHNQRGEPIHQNTSFHVSSLDELLFGIINEGLTRLTVFQVTGTFMNEGDLKNEADKFKKEQIEKQEREQLAKLKAKYENHLSVVE